MHSIQTLTWEQIHASTNLQSLNLYIIYTLLHALYMDSIMY